VWVDHHFIRHGVEHLHQPGLRQLTLQLLGKRVGVADEK
jgi:hypothetical protein